MKMRVILALAMSIGIAACAQQQAAQQRAAEAQRQAQIQNLQNQAQATKQGAYGSSGSVLMQTENQRAALDKIQQALGSGYKSAYDTALTAYNTDAQQIGRAHV